MSEKFIVEGGLSIPSGKFLELAGTDVSATATELNLLDGMTAISTDTNLGTSDTILSTQNAVKSYVDAQLTGADLDITIGETDYGIDLDSESITFAGTTNEVDVSAAADENGNVTITYGLPSDVTIGQHLTVTGNLSAGANKLFINGTQVTATAAELNYLDDDNLTAADLTKLAAVDSTAAELNIVDGDTAASDITVASGDRVVYNDNGTMAQVDVDKIDTYFSGTAKTLTNKTLTSPDINGGTIDDATIAASDVTVGAGKTLDVSAGTLTLADNQISGDKVEGGTIAAITINSLSAGTADIDGGTIDGATIATSDITVGNGKTLNVSAGTLTTSTTQDLAILKSAAGVNDADIDFGAFEVRAQTFESDVATGSAPMTIASTTVVTNLNADKVDGCDVVDEDDMASNSDTSVPTQQSVKKYVDDQLGASALSATIGGTTHAIDLDEQSIEYAGTANEIEVSSAADGDGNVTVTYGLPDAAQIQTLTAGNNTDKTFVKGGTSDAHLFIDGLNYGGFMTLDGTSMHIGHNSSTRKLDFRTDGTNRMEIDGNGNVKIADGSVDFDVASHDGTNGLKLGGTLVTASAAELNDLAGNAVDASDFTKLSEVTSTSTELNIMDGDTSATATTVADADRLVLNDGGTMKQVAMTDFETYFESALDTLSNVTTVGALASGSIASGFGTITTLSACDLGATTVDSMDVSSGGITQAGSIAGATTIDGTGDLTMGSITMTGFSVSAAGLTTMLSGSQLSSGSADAVVANADIANKAYVDSVVTAADLDFTSDGGETLSIDLDSEVLDIAGGSNLTTSASENTITVALDNDVTITGDMTSGTITNAEFTVDASGNTDIDGTLDVASTVDLAATGVATTVRGTLAVTEAATFTAEAEFNGGINCDGQLSMEGNDIVGTADNMLLQADDETAHTFDVAENQLAFQASAGIVFVDEIASNVVPTGTRNLGDSDNHWNVVYGDNVRLDHGHVTSFNSGAISGDDATSILSWGHASFKSAKISMNIKSGNDYTAREVIIVCDENGNNAKLVEYGMLSTGSDLGTLSVAKNGAQIELRVANANGMDCTGVVSFTE